MTVETVQIPAYRTFAVQVARLRRLGPSFLRVTFAGADLDLFATHGPDQRIKVLLPLPGRGITDSPEGPDWYGTWRAQPEGRRMPIRTYTVRAARPEAREVDVDFVLHGATGPASAWAEAATVGDQVVLVGPDARFAGDAGGVEWRPPADSALVVAGDETAVPAICGIVESLPAGRRAHVLMEVPTDGDVLDLAVPAGVQVTWLPRGTARRGAPLTEALRSTVHGVAGPPHRSTALDDVDIERDILWEVPTAPAADDVYVWLAGEAAVVKALRRHLVQEVGLPRSSVAFMGYWREGRVSD
jgi:NADPH-dependent ferric siderophore reductase